MKEVRMVFASYCPLILRCEEHLDSWLASSWSHRDPSLSCCLSPLTEWAWAVQMAMRSFLVLPSSHLNLLHLPASSPLADLATPSKISLAWKDAILWDSERSHRVLFVWSSQPFPPSISDTHHSQIQPCLPFVSPKLGRVSLSRKRALKWILHSWAWLLLLWYTFIHLAGN